MGESDWVGEFWSSPLAESLGQAWDDGSDLFLFGADGSGRVLIVDPGEDRVTVAHPSSCGSLGRWECSFTHFDSERALYRERFPVLVR